MPGIVQVKVAAARDLPVMDRSSELTDAFVEVNQLLYSLAVFVLNNAHHIAAAIPNSCAICTRCTGEAWSDVP